MYKNLLKLSIILGLSACNSNIQKFRYLDNLTRCDNKMCEKDGKTLANGISYGIYSDHNEIKFYLNGERKFLQSNRSKPNSYHIWLKYKGIHNGLIYSYIEKSFNHIYCEIENTKTKKKKSYQLGGDELYDVLKKTNGKLNCEIINKYVKED